MDKRILPNIRSFFILAGCFLSVCSCISFAVSAQPAEAVKQEIESSGPDIAPVKVDGEALFYVRGISSYPAAKRAAAIGKRIEDAAANPDIQPDSVKLIEEKEFLRLFAGTEFIMNIYNVDGEWERVDKSVFALIVKDKVRITITKYRNERTRPALIRKSSYALGALLLLIGLLFLVKRLFRRINNAVEARYQARIRKFEDQAFKLISAEQFWKAIHAFINTVKWITFIVVTSIFLNYILSLFPWTHTVTAYVLHLFTEPIVSFATGIVRFLPSLAFLIVLFFVTRYLLRLTKLLFRGIEQGGIHIKNFDPDWAMPTFKIIRTFILVFVIVIAYPYIPGSQTNAFKGISVFLGILFSLGSSSFIGNVIAGYSMTYRRAFRIGDRIKVDDHVGYVEEQKLLVTRLRSLKNEEIVIPNSVLLNSSIINYSTKAKNPGLILHSTVGIGYETPWRLVHGMLQEAAARTSGLLKEPTPFVLQKSLGDFAVNYEINVYCDDVKQIQLVYTELHQHILDVFNENNVQIMTPAYEGDPDEPKVVPKGQWNTPLATNGDKKKQED